MDKLARQIVADVSEGCGKKHKRKGQMVKALRKVREQTGSAYFKALAATAEDAIEAFLKE